MRIGFLIEINLWMIEFIFYQGKRIMEQRAYCKHTQSSHTIHSYPHNQKGEGEKKKI